MGKQKKKRLTREEAKAKTREALLEAAAEVFAKHGFHGTTIDMVAEEAGYTKGAVYAHFQNKEELYLELLDHHLEYSGGEWIDLIESGTPIKEIFREIEKQGIVELEKSRSWALLTAEFLVYALRNDEVREKLASRFERAKQDYVASLKKRYQKNGGEPPLPYELLATAIMAFENGMSLQYYVYPDPATGAVYASTLARLLDP